MTYTDILGRPPDVSPKVRECLAQHGLPPDELHHRFGSRDVGRGGESGLIVDILMLKIQGEPYRRIAEKYNCAISTIKKWLDEAGVKLEYLPGQPYSEVPAKIHLPESAGRPAIVLQLADEALVGAGDAPKREKSRLPSPQPGLFLGPLFEGKVSPVSEIPPPSDGWRDAAITAREDRDKNRGEVEDAAVNAVEAYYRKHGYKVESVETKRLGWDLEFSRSGCAMLRVEVKGTGFSEWSKVEVELTRNECEKSTEYSDSYRLAIVRDALGNPKCAIYTRDGDGWQQADDFAGDDEDAPDCLKMHPSEDFVIRADTA